MGRAEVAIIGAGAAGLAAAIFTARKAPGRSIVLLDGARTPGAKILMSGGGRCNITNRRVSEKDYQGGSRSVIRRVLEAYRQKQAADFFREIGVSLREEEDGRLFAAKGARQVLDALIGELHDHGIRVTSGAKVSGVERSAEGFVISASSGAYEADRVLLATGGRSVPATGSDGHGYKIAASLGHSIVPPVPALEPLLLSGRMHETLSGISQEVELVLRVNGKISDRVRGPMLWTDFGVSGPAAMDLSSRWHRAGKSVTVEANFVPGKTLDQVQERLRELAVERPRAYVPGAVASFVATRVAKELLAHAKVDPETRLANLTKKDRLGLARALTEFPLPASGGRGWNHAEATAGGVPLTEIVPATMESRKCPGLFLAGEILDADGRIGGFNFQWAWSTAWVAAQSL